MFDNPEKLFILFVIALMIFGPSKLASVGASLGRSIRDFRSAVRGAHEEFRSAVQEHVDSITPALPSPESMSLDTTATPVDYGTAVGASATSGPEAGSAYAPAAEEGTATPASAYAPVAEDDPASLASEPTAAALRESLAR